jgi:hypothetical protein
MNYDHHFRKAMQMLEAAKPASGFRPETPDEWLKLLRANEEMGYAIFRSSGMKDAEARALAKQTYGSPASLILLDIAFSEAAHAKPKNNQ